jgi:hypothetical protein
MPSTQHSHVTRAIRYRRSGNNDHNSDHSPNERLRHSLTFQAAYSPKKRAPRTPAHATNTRKGFRLSPISTTRRQGASALASVLLDHNFDRELWSRPISERCRNIRRQFVYSSHAAESPSSNLRVEATACVALGVSQGYACPAYWMMRICTSSPVLAHHGRELAPRPRTRASARRAVAARMHGGRLAEVDSQTLLGRRLDYGYAPVRLQLCRGTHDHPRTKGADVQHRPPAGRDHAFQL